MWGDTGRYGEIWGDTGRYHLVGLEQLALARRLLGHTVPKVGDERDGGRVLTETAARRAAAEVRVGVVTVRTVLSTVGVGVAVGVFVGVGARRRVEEQCAQEGHAARVERIPARRHAGGAACADAVGCGGLDGQQVLLLEDAVRLEDE